MEPSLTWNRSENYNPTKFDPNLPRYMGLQQKLDEDLKAAMRSRDTDRVEAIRQIKATVTNVEVRQPDPLTDLQIEEIVSRLVRQHRESIDLFTKGNRQELADKETAQLDVLLSYLPAQLSSEAVEELAKSVAAEVGARGPADKGKLMGKLMPQVKGKVEGKVVNEAVDKVLAGLGG